MSEQVVSMLSVLTPMQVACLTMRYRHGMKVKEIAAELSLHRETIRIHIRGAIELLRQQRGVILEFEEN